MGRPVAALADAQRVSDDFVVESTTAGSVQRLRTLFDWDGLQRRCGLKKLWEAKIQVLRVPAGQQRSVMVIRNGSYDSANPRLVFEADPSRGFRSRGGVELPVAGLRIWLVRDDDGLEHDLRGEEVFVLPRW